MGILENELKKYYSKEIHVRYKVLGGFNGRLLKDITIDDGSVVSSVSIVTKNVSNNTLVAVSAAKTIKEKIN